MTMISEPTLNRLDKPALVQLFKACADSVRVAILSVLHNNAYNVQELCQIVALKQSALSHHLKVLATAQLVSVKREGNNLFYRRNIWPHNHPLAALQQGLFDSMDASPLGDDLKLGVAQVEAQRTQASNQFFIENADKFRQQQDVIANFAYYADSVDSLIKSIALPARQQVLEIGPGEGLFLPYLVKQFAHVTALDTSIAMLLQCERLIKQKQLSNIQLIQGDIEKLLKQKPLFDALVINMVLHHIANPSTMFKAAYQLLHSGGGLIITELCHHDQQWTQKACGDIWLGFEPEDLSQWAEDAGLFEGQSSYLAQRNGFGIQIRHFYKPD